jgi:hypothetical protein
VYMAERVTHQLGNGKDLVPVAPLQFTLFPYEAPNKIVNLWTSGVCYLEQLVEDGDFEEYQQSLMPALYPPYEVRLRLLFLNLHILVHYAQSFCISRPMQTFQLVVDIE